jgi:uncharacterized protein Yka (UPF0111/DUF47 family)
MFSIQKFFGKDPKFFDLLEASATEAFNCAHALQTILDSPGASATLHQVRQARQNSKQLMEEIGELAVKTFVTFIDREDIEELGNALYKIPKPIEKFAERYLISRDIFGNGHPFQQVGMIESATMTVLEMIKSLRKGINSDVIRKLNTKLQQAEAQADNLELDLLRDLYRSNQSPVQIMVIRDLYDLLEKVTDRCRDAGNLVMHICHKNS